MNDSSYSFSTGSIFIKERWIKALVGHVNEIKIILTDVVERTGRT